MDSRPGPQGDHGGAEKSPTGGALPGVVDRIAVVVNGNAKQVTDELVETLDQIVQSGDLFVSRSLEEAHDIARTIVVRGYPTVLTGGGDGTFVRMVTAIVQEAENVGRQPPRFGLLRLGTGNALAWVLGAQSPKGRGVVADLARLRSEGGSRELRLIEVAGLLTPFAGLGADAIALSDYGRTKERFMRVPGVRRVATGPVVYSASMLTRTIPRYVLRPALKFAVVNEGSPAIRMGQNGRPVGASIPAGELIYEGPAQLLAFSTIPYWGLGARAFPYAEERPDRMHLRIVNFGSVEAMLNLRSIWQGVHRSDRMHDFLVDGFSLTCNPPTPLQVGGDVLGHRSQVRARLAEQPIRVVDYYSPPPV
ncbi:MAG: diacylglycerol kinase family protein [Myxococcales bacterium]|nr:diacylglycerol kinase family protein [Myxococcales bacterium]